MCLWELKTSSEWIICKNEIYKSVKDSRKCVYSCALIILKREGRCRDGKKTNLRWRDEGTAKWEREVSGRMKKRKQTCFLILLILFLMVRTGWGVIARGRANGVIHPTVTIQQSWNTATIRDNTRVEYRRRGRELSWSSALLPPKSHMRMTLTWPKN